MQRFAWLALCGAVLSGCNYTVYHQPGKTIQDRERALVHCDVKALKEAPVASEIRYTAPQLEERKICDNKGNCIIDTYWSTPDPYTVDVNETLRHRIKEQCMIQRGYDKVSLPKCENGSAVSIPARMGKLGPQSCVVRSQGGTLRISDTG